MEERGRAGFVRHDAVFQRLPYRGLIGDECEKKGWKYAETSLNYSGNILSSCDDKHQQASERQEHE